MIAKALGIRREDQRDTTVAFATLVAILAAHSMLETARDTLFLAKLPAEQLPFAYMAIAFFALVVSKLNQAATTRFPRRALLSGTLMGGGAITALFFELTASRGGFELGALYVWTGVLATAVVVQFWLQLGDVLDVGQAKRLFSIIAAGGLLGATMGSAVAGALLTVIEPRHLLLVAAALFVIAGLLPLGFQRSDSAEAPLSRTLGTPRRSGLREVLGDPYLLRLFIIVIVGAIVVTGVDFIFKAKVVAEAENQGWDLGSFFAGYYAVVNALALVVQVLIAPRLLGAVGVNRALLVMPILMLVGAVGFAATIGLVPALMLKGTDGAMRHSVHRTASEILYLPLPRSVRERFKGFAEAVGQRGGQAVASLALLGVTAVTSDARLIAAGLAVLAGIWVATMMGMQPHYLELFRRQLREGTLETELDIPDLDLASFETLVSALSSEDDTEVIAALEMFEIYGKTALVPALILYHPSREVVHRAFELFARGERPDVQRLAGRLLKHEDEEIRAAALRTLAAGGSDEERLGAFLDDPSPAVGCTALVALASNGFITENEAAARLKELAHGSSESQIALARALRQLPAERYAWLAEELARQPHPRILPELARALAVRPHRKHIPVLIKLLARRESRGPAREALLALGDEAFDRLVVALANLTLAPDIRRHVPRTLSRFPGERAIDALLHALARECDDRVAYKILRGLGRMRMNQPDLPVDRELLFVLAKSALEQAIAFLHWRLVVGRVVIRQQETMTRAAELLVAFLDEKQHKAIEKVFRILHIIEPQEDFRIIFLALQDGDKKAKATSRELVSHLVPSPLREGILAMVGEGGPRARLREARAFYDPPGRAQIETAFARTRAGAGSKDAECELSRAYAMTLREMLGDPSEALRAIVGYHVVELGLDELTGIIVEAARTNDVLGEIAVSNPGLLMEPSHAG